jgi:IS5 family transposase
MKNDGKLGRNYLKGLWGDRFNTILCGIAHNMRLIYSWLAAYNSPTCLYSGYKSLFSFLTALLPYLEGYLLL